LFCLAVVGFQCGAQTLTPTPDQIDSTLVGDLRGDGFVHACHFEKGQIQAVCTVDRDTIVAPERPHQPSIGQTVSVQQLRHKVPKEAAREFQHALKLSRAGEHDRAVAELEAALDRDPELSSAADRLGVEYIYLNRWEAAEKAFRRSIDLDPAWWMGHYNLGLVRYVRGDQAGAEQSMRRALALSSENAKIHLALGAMLIKREETRTEGIGELKVAARTLADAKRALRELGVR
jgi:tetratricopeptide (TPR) repeat protein